MTTASPALQERRKFLRNAGSPPIAINLVHSNRSVLANSVNFNEAGLCLRVQETLEVRSLVRLQLTPGSSLAKQVRASTRPQTKYVGVGARWQRPLQCTGRVTWVVQRLDLRDNPPFLFDVGIEFVDPPPLLRQFLAQRGGRLGLERPAAVANKSLAPALIRSRQYVPRLERSSNPALGRWHLVVAIDGVPCFSEHYPSERAAMAAWATFKRRQAKR